LDAGDIRTAETFAQLLRLQSSLSTAIVVYCNPPGRLCLHSDDKTGYRRRRKRRGVRCSFRPRAEIFFLGAVFMASYFNSRL